MSLNLKNLAPPSGWSLSVVGKVCNIHNNLRLPISEEERKKIQGEYPYYGPTGILDYIDHFRVQGKFALIGEDGDHFLKYSRMPMTLLVDGKFNVNNHAHIVSGRDDCLTEWFYQFFRHTSIEPYLTRQGAGRYKLNKAALEKLPILIPPLSEQDKIISLLTTWDRAITCTERLIASLQIRKKGLMQRLLTGKVRFSTFRNEWQLVGLNQVFSERKELATQSQGFELFSLTIENGITPKTDRYNREFLVRSDDKKYKKVYPDDIVYNPSNLRWGAIGKSHQSRVVLVSPIYEVLEIKDRNSHDADFVFYALSNPDQIQRFSQLGEGTLIERIAVKIDTFLMSKISIPPTLAEQIQIADVLKSCDKEIKSLSRKLDLLKLQKKALMQKLLTGQIRVRV